jgi:hypothetical protein
MKIKILAFLLLFIGFYGCEKKFNSLIDNQTLQYQVTNLTQADSFSFNFLDSSFTITISFQDPSAISLVWSDVYSPDDQKINTSPVYLLDNGQNGDLQANDNTYSGLFYFSQSYPNGYYQIEYFVQDKNGLASKVGSQNIYYDNKKGNKPPVIFNLSAPDTVYQDTTTEVLFLITVAAYDTNGQNEIAKVFFNSFIPPDGQPSTGNPFIMYDDGTHGDKVANDGIYSLTIELPISGVPKGQYRWEFQALDRINALSNKIVHYIVIL